MFLWFTNFYLFHNFKNAYSFFKNTILQNSIIIRDDLINFDKNHKIERATLELRHMDTSELLTGHRARSKQTATRPYSHGLNYGPKGWGL